MRPLPHPGGAPSPEAPMNVLVCVKHVPDTETRIKIAPDGLSLDLSGANWIISPYDEIAVEEAIRIRTAIADAHERLTLNRWEQTAAMFMRNVWMVDCQSLSDSLTTPTFSKCSDKRLSIDIAALRQMLRTTPDQALRDELTPDGSDVVI